jgi:acetyl esterase/lipase
MKSFRSSAVWRGARARLFGLLAWLLIGAAWAYGGEVTVLRDVAFLEPGRAEKLDLYLPARAGAETATPAVIWIHGGGFTGGDKADARETDVCSNLAAAGFVCASVNYRLGERSWPTNLLDCKNAVRFLKAQAPKYRIDPRHIAVMGGSAGGVLALMVGFTTGRAEWEPAAPYPAASSAVAAVGNFYGAANFLTREKPSPTGALTGQPGDMSGLEKAFGVAPGAPEEVWRALSPVSHITRASPPVLIAHGLADPLSAYSQALDLARALAAQGVSHQLVMLGGVGHSFGLTKRGKNPLPRDLRPVVIDFLQSCGFVLARR